MNCRICNGELKQLLEYENMPKSAQFLPETPDDKGITLKVCQCLSCSTVQLDNEPVSYHHQVVRTSGLSKDMMSFRKFQFLRFVDQYNLKGKHLFEVGSGTGEFVQLMREAGAFVEGKQYFDDTCPMRGNFDGFYILNFLEHLPDPNCVLKGIWNNIVPGGIGLVEVPNFNVIYKNGSFDEFIIDHLFYFNTESLNALLVRNGFQILEVKSIWQDYILSMVVKKPETLDFAHFNAKMDKVIGQLQGFADVHKDCAIWGASHQALTVIALAGLGDRIRYVVDSAPFKQDKFTPATHIPIRPPQALKDDPVTSIIVMAASYSDEVVKIIKRDYPGMKITVLRETGLKND